MFRGRELFNCPGDWEVAPPVLELGVEVAYRMMCLDAIDSIPYGTAVKKLPTIAGMLGVAATSTSRLSIIPTQLLASRRLLDKRGQSDPAFCISFSTLFDPGEYHNPDLMDGIMDVQDPQASSMGDNMSDVDYPDSGTEPVDVHGDDMKPKSAKVPHEHSSDSSTSRSRSRGRNKSVMFAPEVDGDGGPPPSPPPAAPNLKRTGSASSSRSRSSRTANRHYRGKMIPPPPEVVKVVAGHAVHDDLTRELAHALGSRTLPIANLRRLHFLCLTWNP